MSYNRNIFNPSRASLEDRPQSTLPLKARLLNFLEERPGVAFEPEELASEFGGNRDAIRKTLERLWRSGLIQTEQRTKPNNNGKGGQTKYKVYLVTEMEQRLELLQGNGLVTAPSQDLLLFQDELISDTSEVAQRLELLPDKDSLSLLQKDSGTDPIIDVKTVPVRKLGDKVVHKGPAQKSYNWHGVITSVKDDGSCYVRWSERRGMKGGDVLWYRFSDLRLI